MMQKMLGSIKRRKLAELFLLGTRYITGLHLRLADSTVQCERAFLRPVVNTWDSL